MRNYKKKIVILLSTVLFLILVSYHLIIHIAPYSIIKPYRSTNNELTNYLRNHYKKIELNTKDSLTLVGYLIESKVHQPKGTMILLHGIGDNKESQIGLAEYLSANGYNTIIFDLRAHGQSEGKYCTYGYYEKFDVKEFINKAEKEVIDLQNVGIIGTSLGGAIAIQSMATDSRIKCGVIVSTFSSLNEIVYDYMKRMLHIPLKFVSDMALNEAGKIAKFPPKEINPINYASKIEQPILLIHGSNDDRINIQNGKNIYSKIKSRDKLFYEVKNAGHNDIGKVGGIKYRSEILNFLDHRMAKFITE